MSETEELATVTKAREWSREVGIKLGQPKRDKDGSLDPADALRRFNLSVPRPILDIKGSPTREFDTPNSDFVPARPIGELLTNWKTSLTKSLSKEDDPDIKMRIQAILDDMPSSEDYGDVFDHPISETLQSEITSPQRRKDPLVQQGTAEHQAFNSVFLNREVL